LGLFWVCFGFVFEASAETKIFINLFPINGYVGFLFWEIGFVLHKKGQICRGLSTNVEGNFVSREAYLDTKNTKYEARNSKQYQNLNDPNSKVCLDCQIKVYVRVSADTKTCGSPLNTCHFYGD